MSIGPHPRPERRSLPEERYIADIEFKYLVDLMEMMIARAQYTPLQLKEAATLAAIHYEYRVKRLDFWTDGAIGGMAPKNIQFEPGPESFVLFHRAWVNAAKIPNYDRSYWENMESFLKKTAGEKRNNGRCFFCGKRMVEFNYHLRGKKKIVCTNPKCSRESAKKTLKLKG